MGRRVVADNDDGEMWLCATFFQVVDAVEQFALNLRSARFSVQTLCWHGLPTLNVALSVPSPMVSSKRRFDAHGSDDAPTCTCLKNSEGTTEDATGYSVPSESKSEQIGGQEGGQHQ